MPSQCLPYWSFREQISFSDGILFKGEKIIIPKAMQSEMLKLIHSSHLGIAKSFKPSKRHFILARNVISNSRCCFSLWDLYTYQSKNHKEPLIPHSVPDRPWYKLGIDIYELQGKQYVVIVDYYSRFVELDLLTNTTAKQVINHCKSQFSRHAILDVLISDNGTQFSSHEFKQFIKHYQINHHTSIPYHPQSNGMAEIAVQTVKRLIMKATHNENDPYLALLEYRNAPWSWSDTLGSPAQRLISRRTKTLLPTSSTLLKPETSAPKQYKKSFRNNKVSKNCIMTELQNR